MAQKPRAEGRGGTGALSRVKSIAQRDVLLDYAYAELLEPNRFYSGAVSLAAHVERIGGFNRLSPAEHQQAIELVRRTREPMLGFLLANKTDWFEASIEVDELEAVRLTSWFEQQPQYQRARTLEELLSSPGATDYVKGGFRLALMRGRPIMVARALGGPY